METIVFTVPWRGANLKTIALAEDPILASHAIQQPNPSRSVDLGDSRDKGILRRVHRSFVRSHVGGKQIPLGNRIEVLFQLGIMQRMASFLAELIFAIGIGQYQRLDLHSHDKLARVLLGLELQVANLLEMAGGVELVEELCHVGQRRTAIEQGGEFLVFRPNILGFDLQLTEISLLR